MINYVHQTGVNLYDATNIVKIPRPTNVFRGVMEQIYIKLDTQQGFRERTSMRLPKLFISLLSMKRHY